MWSYYTVKCEIYISLNISLKKNVNAKLTEERNCKIFAIFCKIAILQFLQVLKWHVYLSIALIVLLSSTYSFKKKKMPMVDAIVC